MVAAEQRRGDRDEQGRERRDDAGVSRAARWRSVLSRGEHHAGEDRCLTGDQRADDHVDQHRREPAEPSVEPSHRCSPDRHPVSLGH